MLRRGAIVFAFVACSSQAPMTKPPPDVVGVDENDVECEPLDGVMDDSTMPATPSAAPLIQWVDPKIGTGGVAWGTGSTYPGAQFPFGMARPSPDTSYLGAAADFLHCSGYSHDDDTIDGFSHFHLHGAGIADYGGMALMPTIGMTPEKSAPRGHGAKFQHASEKASPGYYSVALDTNILVELTASAHAAFHRWTFPNGSDAVAIVDARHVLADGEKVDDASVTIDPANKTVSGYAHVVGSYSKSFGGVALYFFARFDTAFSSYGTYAGGVLTDSSTTSNEGAYVHFASANVEAHVGVSFVDVAHAKSNLDAEDGSFDAVRRAAEDAWEARLRSATIEARSDADRRIFYTALYHTALMPALVSDVDGTYRGIDGKVHAGAGRTFSDFSLWDTYRNLHSLIALVYPDDARDLARSLVQMGKDAGFLPRWPLGPGETGGMLGDGATIVLADTYVRGVQGWDAQGGYAIARAQATNPMGARDHLGEWMSLGYIPSEESAAVAKSLEYAAADFALSRWAAAMGQQADADLFAGRAANWKKLYDASSHFLFPRAKDGTMVPVDPLAIGGPYTEGSAWHYDFMVPFDVDGLSQAMTRPVLLGRLEQLFTRSACTGKSPFLPNPYYWPANEPDLFSGWMFGALGDGTRAGRWLRWTTLTHYTDQPGGLPGNDDSGAMSAFYIFASVGFYPIPGSDLWVLGSPLFEKATLGPVTIEAPGASKLTRFVRSTSRNGQPAGPVLRQADLAGSTIHFELTR